MPGSPTTRTRGDRCPGVLRPWIADDGALVRIRLVGGRLPARSLAALSRVATAYGDGRLHLTTRANLQLRALPVRDGRLPEEVVTAIEATGLLPSRTHERARNVMVSPGTGLAGGRADLRPVARRLDDLLLAAPEVAGLPGRFLVVLDDGRGDLLDRSCDLGAVALDGEVAQVRLGSAGWGPVVALSAVAETLVSHAVRFLEQRGTGPTAPWHVDELATPTWPRATRDPRVPAASGPPPYDRTEAGEHVPAPDGVLDAALVGSLAARAVELVVTPWRGVLVPRAAR